MSKTESTAVRKRKMEETALPSDSEEESDADMEANFALLTNHSRARGGEEEGDEEYGSSDEEEEDAEERGDGSDEEEEEDAEEQGDGSDEEEEEDAEEQGDGSDEEEEDAVEEQGEELSSMSFEDILKLQQKVGTKAYNKIAHGNSDAPRPQRAPKRLNKNRPIEISSKRSVPFLREVVPVKKSVRRDPRFDDLSGEYKPEIFEKTYSFIKDIKHTEKESVKKMLKKSHGATKKEQLKSLVMRMENQERERRKQEVQREKDLEFKRKQKAQAVQGLQPFFLSKGQQNKLQLAEKYEQLKRSGKLENFLTKKRKRNATKDRKKLPYQNYKHQNPQ
ncbi:unnamed protein product [Merluccius merluccius]